jgi:hypothetical protein
MKKGEYMVNVEFLIVAYLVGLFVDWVFQWDWQAVNKSKWGKNDNKIISFTAVISHSATYAFITTIVISLLLNHTLNLFIIYNTLLISHAIIDTRIPVKAIMRFKGMTKEQINDYQNYGFMHIGIDHRLHEMVLLILACLI